MDKSEEVIQKTEEKTEIKEDLSKDLKKEKRLSDWVPKTTSGRKTRNGEIASLDQYLSLGNKILEPEVVDNLLSDLQEELIEFTKTTRVTRSGRVFSFRATVLVGDGESYIGVGTGKDKERFPAMRKAAKNARLSIQKISKGCASWECGCSEPHSVPFRVEGKSSSVRVVLMPAPKGTGLVVGNNIKKTLEFVGIKDVWCKTFGNTASKLDFIKASIDALSKTRKMKYSDDIAAKIGGKQ